jgi:hypothetical protein
MRLFASPANKGKYFPGNSVLHQSPGNKLFVVHHNKQMSFTGRTTTTYNLNDDTNDPACTGSFFLLPDPYCENKNNADNYLQDFLSEDEEMMLFDVPPKSNHSPFQI